METVALGSVAQGGDGEKLAAGAALGDFKADGAHRGATIKNGGDQKQGALQAQGAQALFGALQSREGGRVVKA